MTLDCLHTVVKNMSGVEKYFGFLPPHGVKLADGEELAVAGDLVTRIASAKDADRSFPAFENALDNTDIVILHSPALFLFDTTIEATQQVRVRNRVVGTVEPCWGYFSESGGDSFAGG
jgi:hypothetical protein